MRPLSCRWAIGGGFQGAVADPDSSWRQRLRPPNSPLCPTTVGRGAWRTPKLLSSSSRRTQKSCTQICERSDMAALVLYILWVSHNSRLRSKPKTRFSLTSELRKKNRGCLIHSSKATVWAHWDRNKGLCLAQLIIYIQCTILVLHV